MKKLANKDECTILRGTPDSPGFAMLIDCEGNEVFTAPYTWTDEQIWTALEIANFAYSNGVSMGRFKKSVEIMMALESE